MPVAIVPHQYVVFDRLKGGAVPVTNELPVVRDYERKIYIKPEVGGLVVSRWGARVTADACGMHTLCVCARARVCVCVWTTCVCLKMRVLVTGYAP